MPVFAALEKKRLHTVSAAAARKATAAPRRARATSRPLNVSGFDKLPAGAQAKLSVSVPSDPLEQEADRVADAVLREHAEGASIAVGGIVGTEISRKCASCEEGEDAPAVAAPEPEDMDEQPQEEVERSAAAEEGEAMPVDFDLPLPEEVPETNVEETALASPPPSRMGLHRKAVAASPQPRNVELSDVVPDAGRPIEPAVRADLEARFNYSFENVRIHTGQRAEAAARSVNALAYAYGRDIVFGAGQYAPESPAGRRVLAHELTHVVQQRGVTARVGSPQTAHPAASAAVRSPAGDTIYRWAVDGKSPNINTIVCDGKGGIRVQLGATGNANQTKCLSACMRAHEMSHRSDALASNAKICRGKGNGNYVGTTTAAERKATEIKASQVEINCLKKARPSASATCKRIIDARIPQMEAYRDSFK